MMIVVVSFLSILKQLSFLKRRYTVLLAVLINSCNNFACVKPGEDLPIVPEVVMVLHSPI